MTMAIAIMAVWFFIGFIGYVADRYETYETLNPFMLVFLVMTPCFPFIFHACGLF